MKKSNIITIIMGVVFVLLIGMIVLIMTNKINLNSKKQADTNSHNSVENNRTSEQEKAKKTIDNAAKIETNGKKENLIVVITDKESGEKYNITDKDLELFKILASEEEDTEESIKEKAIEDKILSKGAQKLGVMLRQNKISEIEEMTNSEEILGRIPKSNKIARDNFRKRLYNYLVDSAYCDELNQKIYKEISNKKLSVSGTTIDDKLQQHIKLSEKIKNSDNLSNEEWNNYGSEKLSLYKEIRNLYLEIIKDKYTVEYK